MDPFNPELSLTAVRCWVLLGRLTPTGQRFTLAGAARNRSASPLSGRGLRVENERNLAAADRVVRLLRHVGIERMHIVQGAAEAAAHPEMVASLALVTPAVSASSPLHQLAVSGTLAPPPLLIHSDAGPLSAAAAFVRVADPDATAVVLGGYASALWTDTVADRAEEIAAALLTHLAEAQRLTPLPTLALAGEGEVAGVTYRARGAGPPVFLFPLHLAPSQWEPILPVLAEHFCTIIIGGPHLGFASILEQRAVGGYGVVVDELIDALGLTEGGSAVDVGCGTGAFTRRLARRLGPAGRVVGADISAYLLREAAALARRQGLEEVIRFEVGSAEALTFPDGRFDAALACTVLDEVDAERALAELARVVRPKGRVAVLVRAVDIPTWDSLPLRPELRAKVAARPTGGVTAGVCADGSLYRRFRAAGFRDVTMGPRLAIDRAEDALPEWRAYYEGSSVGVLNETEAAEWHAVAAHASAERSFLWASAYHCAVGTMP
jgi:SAM-dependent methyltransferase